MIYEYIIKLGTLSGASDRASCWQCNPSPGCESCNYTCVQKYATAVVNSNKVEKSWPR